jgi:hypothetical protein
MVFGSKNCLSLSLTFALLQNSSPRTSWPKIYSSSLQDWFGSELLNVAVLPVGRRNTLGYEHAISLSKEWKWGKREHLPLSLWFWLCLEISWPISERIPCCHWCSRGRKYPGRYLNISHGRCCGHGRKYPYRCLNIHLTIFVVVVAVGDIMADIWTHLIISVVVMVGFILADMWTYI